jgi:glycosyltransferase involved in cell wall biosynthesis
VIGFAGALQPHKGAHLLLAALRRLQWRDVRVRIAGGGDRRYERKLRRLARGLNVAFLGRVPPAEMPEFLRGLDLLVLPSLWPENLPIIMLEAYASGVPVLASDVGGMAEFIAHSRFLFEPGSVESLVDCLAVWREGVGTEYPRNFPRISTAAEMCEATLGIYSSCLSAERS